MSVSRKFMRSLLQECMARVHNDPENTNSSNQKDLEMLRTAMIAELDAVNLYEQMASQADSEAVRRVLLSVAREEKVHIGEFETLLEELDTEAEEAEEEGEEEVSELL